MNIRQIITDKLITEINTTVYSNTHFLPDNEWQKDIKAAISNYVHYEHTKKAFIFKNEKIPVIIWKIKGEYILINYSPRTKNSNIEFPKHSSLTRSCADISLTNFKKLYKKHIKNLQYD